MVGEYKPDYSPKRAEVSRILGAPNEFSIDDSKDLIFFVKSEFDFRNLQGQLHVRTFAPMCLTHYHTMTNFDALKIYNCISHNVFYLLQHLFSFKMHFKMSSAISFELDQSKILQFGKELKS